MHLAAERMARLVTDLLTLARFEQTEARLRAEPVDADELVRDAARAARPSTRDHLVAVEAAAGPVAVLGDRDAVERILVNLLDNAAKYSPAGSRIAVAIRAAGDGLVEVAVADRGPGVPPGERERIIERLYRGDRSRSNGADHGAGLGLAICRALARGQGGDMTVRDTPGGGATFAVTLPRAPERSPVETGQDPRSGVGCALSTVVDMNEGMKTILFPVSDPAKAKAVFRVLLGEPTSDAPYYVGYEVEGMQIGLVPNGQSQGMPSTVPFWHVDDIESRLQALVDAGAEPLQPIRNVGGGRRTASVKDADGNPIGLIQDPS